MRDGVPGHGGRSGRDDHALGEFGCALVEVACQDFDYAAEDSAHRSYLAYGPHDQADPAMAELRAQVDDWIVGVDRAFMAGADVRLWLALHGVVSSGPASSPGWWRCCGCSRTTRSRARPCRPMCCGLWSASTASASDTGWCDGTMAVGDLDQHAHLLTGLALQRLSQDHPDGGDVALFSAVFKAWLGWAGVMHCTVCEQQLLEAAQINLAEAQRQHLH